MSKNYLRLSLCVLMQTLLPIMTLFILTPLLIDTKIIKQWQQPLENMQLGFIALHGLFYITLIFLWPKLVMRLQSKNQINTAQFMSAINIRWYLITVFLCIDILMIWRMA